MNEEEVKLYKSVTEMQHRINELEAQIEKMKADIKQEQSYWNDCEMQFHLLQSLLDKWEVKE